VTEFFDQKFVRERIVLDGHKFHRCTFHQCLLPFGATAETDLGECDFEAGTQLVVNEGATRTFKFLYQLYHGGFPDYVEGVFESIRRPPRAGDLAVDPENLPPES
jgi:hypothetical protein